MRDYNGYRVFIFGAIIFVILQGMCAVLADTNTVMVIKSGSSLNLTLTYPQNSVLFVQWYFNEERFAEYSRRSNYTPQGSKFRGRVKGFHDIVGVTLQDLQLQDSGTFTTVAIGPKGQYPTQKIQVYIQNPIRVVQIKKSQTWSVSTNSCDVDVKCEALGAENVFFLWSGYSYGAQLQFSLSPEEGAVTLNCTAANNVSSSSASETLSCSTKTDATRMLVWIAVAAGVTIIVITAVIAYLNCYRKSQKDAAADGNTVYADVNPGAVTKKDKQPDTVAEGMTVYETVDDLRIAPEMTIYAKVTLPQHTKVCATPSSPYQKVL